MKATFDIDERTGIARTNVWSAAYLKNDDIARARLIIGRGGRILKDPLGGRTDMRATPEIIAEYERAAG